MGMLDGHDRTSVASTLEISTTQVGNLGQTRSKIKMVKQTLIIGSLVLMTGCASSPEWLIGSDCQTLGCGRDLEFYPNEQYGAVRQARDWHGFEWGKTSSAYAPGTPEYERLKAEEIAKGQTPWHWNNPDQ